MKRFTILLVLTLLLTGCTKTASESAADAAMHQVDAVEHQVKKECPAAKIDKQMDALRATIQAELRSCESEKKTLSTQIIVWRLVSFCLLMAVAFLLYIKIL